MAKELKARIHDLEKVKKNLQKLCASFQGKINSTDIYYNQPEGKVLRLTETIKGNKLISLKAQGEGFVIEKAEEIKGPNAKKKELKNKFGINCILERTISTYSYDNEKVSIHEIKDVGNFLILESENPKPEKICKLLDEKNLEFIKVSFDTLKK